MALCQITSKPELYGLGIRIAYYIQWAGAVLMAYLNERRLPDVRFLGVLLCAGSALSIVIGAARDDLEPADIYISLLLAAGIFLFLVPLYIWRGLTLCNPYWDPMRWTEESPIPVFQFANFALLVAVSSLATWYYTSFLSQWDREVGCEQYGFFFSKVSLHNTVYVAFNALLYLIIIIVCAGVLLKKAGCRIYTWTKERRRRRIRQDHVDALRTMRNMSNIVVLAVLIAAVELTIQWNEIDDVNDIDTAAQTIPLLLSAGIVVRVIFFHFAGAHEESSDEEEDDYHHHHRVRVSVHDTTQRSSRGETTEIPPPANAPPPPSPPPPAHGV